VIRLSGLGTGLLSTPAETESISHSKDKWKQDLAEIIRAGRIFPRRQLLAVIGSDGPRSQWAAFRLRPALAYIDR